MKGLDRVIHEPVRLRILCLLAGVKTADFKFLLTTLQVSTGNLSSHMDKLEKARYVKTEKSFNGKFPQTKYRLTAKGRSSLQQHWKALDEIRETSNGVE